MIKKNSGKKPQEEKRARLVNMRQWILEKKGQLKLFSYILIIASLYISPLEAKDQIEVWTDEQGIKHYEHARPSSLIDQLPQNSANTSFEELTKNIEAKLSKSNDKKLKKYLQPLQDGMTEKEVRKIWGHPERGLGIIEGKFTKPNEPDKKFTAAISLSYLHYKLIGISLSFKNDNLIGWSKSKEITEPTPKRNNTNNIKTIKYEDLIKNKKERLENQEHRFYDKVTINISGCPTLQNSLDEQKGNQGHAIAEISGDGRTLKEICNSVGRGCDSCLLVPDKNQ